MTWHPFLNVFDVLGVNPKIGLPQNTPKWMVLVKIMENRVKIDDLGGFPLFLETPK